MFYRTLFLLFSILTTLHTSVTVTAQYKETPSQANIGYKGMDQDLRTVLNYYCYNSATHSQEILQDYLYWEAFIPKDLAPALVIRHANALVTDHILAPGQDEYRSFYAFLTIGHDTRRDLANTQRNPTSLTPLNILLEHQDQWDNNTRNIEALSHQAREWAIFYIAHHRQPRLR